MKIIIAGGTHEADYIISMYHKRNNHLIVINPNEETCHYLSEKNDIPVLFGKPTKETDLEKAGIQDADLFIALSVNDIDNYVACCLAKRFFNVKRCIATVINPKNVEIFKTLGVDSVVSSTYLLAQQIERAASIENLIEALSLEDDQIMILELLIKKEHWVCDQNLSALHITDLGSVSCIYRDRKALIPNGATTLKENDKVLLVTTKENRSQLIDLFQKKHHEE